MILDSPAFIAKYANSFVNGIVAGWQWEPDDEVFGKTVSWDVGLNGATATVDLAPGQLTMTIVERDPAQPDPDVVFNVLVSFDEQRIARDGVSLPYDDENLVSVIKEFNERT